LGRLSDSRDIGASPSEKEVLDVADCRKLTRTLLLHGLALLHTGTPDSVAALCAKTPDQVQTGRWIVNVIDELYSRLQPWHP
jgi:hypothetical protein